MAKLEFFGKLNGFAGQIEGARKDLDNLYESGDCRLRVDEIDLIDKICADIDVSKKEILRIRNKFAKIANGKGVPQVVID